MPFDDHPMPEDNCNDDADWQIESDLPPDLYLEVEKLIAIGFGNGERAPEDTSQ